MLLLIKNYYTNNFNCNKRNFFVFKENFILKKLLKQFIKNKVYLINESKIK